MGLYDSVPLLDGFRPRLLHNAIAAPSAAPTTIDNIQFGSKQFARIRVWCDYNAVTAGNLRLFTWDPVNSQWYRIGDSNDLDPLVPANGDECRDYFVGRGALVHIQVQALTGTAITVRATGVDAGAESV